jgi:hypothetical protein
MKRLLVYVLVLVSLAACAGSASFGRHNCSKGGEVCVEVRAEEPITFGKPVTVKITITSEKDIEDIGISLSHDPDVVVEESQGWEKDSRDISFFSGGVSWVATIEADSPITFKRTLYLPPRGGSFYLITTAGTSYLEARDMIRIYMTKEGGKVYLSGTTIPSTPGPVPTMDPDLLATANALPTYTPYASLPVPETPTPLPISKTEPPPPVILGTPAYPPPSPYP